jgi:hypothetical protein
MYLLLRILLVCVTLLSISLFCAIRQLSMGWFYVAGRLDDTLQLFSKPLWCLLKENQGLTMRFDTKSQLIYASFVHLDLLDRHTMSLPGKLRTSLEIPIKIW